MFKPKRVIFQQQALEYDVGKNLLNRFKKDDNVEIKYSKSGRIIGIPGKTLKDMYFEGKSTLVVGVRKALKFQTCKPSAHFQLPLVSGCMGMCEYCYLNTQMGKKPYIKIYVNVDEILNKAEEYIQLRKPDITIFEGAATSDPVPVESYGKALEKAIEYFGRNDKGFFRFVTKYTDIDSLLNLNHNKKTTVRFSINTDEIINKFEHKTPSFLDRINAAFKMGEKGYNLGFIIAPVFIYENWEAEYLDLLITISKMFKNINLKFEIISHRFTERAKKNILDIYPETMLPMNQEVRTFKYGQFGYGKYIYTKEQIQNIKEFFTKNIIKYFGEDSINYII